MSSQTLANWWLRTSIAISVWSAIRIQIACGANIQSFIGCKLKIYRINAKSNQLTWKGFEGLIEVVGGFVV